MLPPVSLAASRVGGDYTLARSQVKPRLSTTPRALCYVRAVLRGSTKTAARLAPLLACSCACWALLALRAPAIAHAYEDQFTLGIGVGYANAVSDRLPQHGALFDVAGSVGLSGAWSVRGRVTYAFHPDDAPLHVALIDAELLYLIDVVEVVPYFGLGAGAIGRARGGDVSADAASHLVVGLDYLLSRELTLGLDVRAHALWTALDHDPLYVAATASVIWMFDR